MALRPYQEEDLTAIFRDIVKRKIRRQLIFWATGLGKAVLCAHYAGRRPWKGQLVITVPREILAVQNAEKIHAEFPHLKIGIEQGSNQCDPSTDDVIISTVQSIGSAKKLEDGSPDWNKRLLKFNPERITDVIVDEAHHVSSATHRHVLKYLRVYQKEPQYNDPDKNLLLLTATPNRTDNQDLSEFVNYIGGAYFNPDTGARGRDIYWGVKNGYLAHPEGHRVNTYVDISNVDITAGDFNEKQLAKTVNTPERNQIVVENYIDITKRKKGIFFTCDIQHAEDLAAVFNDHGVRACAVSSRNNHKERQKMIQMHKDGYFTILCGADIFIEGYDDPTIEVGGMVRPTKSNLVYTQSVGRVLRPFPAPEALAAMRSKGVQPSHIKQKAIIIDYVDISSKHSLITIPKLFGLSSKFDPQGKDIVELLDQAKEEVKKLPASKQDQVKLDEIESMVALNSTIEAIDLISIPTVPAEITAVSNLNWLPYPNGYQIGLDNHTTFTLRNDSLGGYAAFEIVKGIQRHVADFPNLKSAIQSIESRIPADSKELARADLSWKTKKVPISPKQLGVIVSKTKYWPKQFKTKDEVTKYLVNNVTKGQASNMITLICNGQNPWQI